MAGSLRTAGVRVRAAGDNALATIGRAGACGRRPRAGRRTTAELKVARVERASVEAEPTARVGMLNQASGEFSRTDPHAGFDGRVLVCELG